MKQPLLRLVWTVAGLLLCMMLLVPFLPPVRAYLAELKNAKMSSEHEPLPVEETLWQQIEQLAADVEHPAQDARIDPVWKAIPGYNGLAVDRALTFQLARQRPGQPLVPIVRETEPAVHLEQLMPAPIYRGNPDKPMVGFLINVAWGEEHLPSMLSILQEEEVKATFFFDGSWAKAHPQWVQDIAAQGHEIGNHAYSHPMMSRLTESAMDRQIRMTNQVLEELLGSKPRYFAPPAGDYNQKVVDVAYRHGMWTILWTLDTVDWKNPRPEWILRRIVPIVDNGHLILMHPTTSTVQALKPLIRHIREKGLQLGTVSDVLSEKRTDVVRLLEF